jgi:hypothetical protein
MSLQADLAPAAQRRGRASNGQRRGTYPCDVSARLVGGGGGQNPRQVGGSSPATAAIGLNWRRSFQGRQALPAA